MSRHIHQWAISKDVPGGSRLRAGISWNMYGPVDPTGLFESFPRKLERECALCGARQHADVTDPGALPPTPLLALADLAWVDGKLR